NFLIRLRVPLAPPLKLWRHVDGGRDGWVNPPAVKLKKIVAGRFPRLTLIKGFRARPEVHAFLVMKHREVSFKSFVKPANGFQVFDKTKVTKLSEPGGLYPFFLLAVVDVFGTAAPRNSDNEVFLMSRPTYCGLERL